MSTQTTARSLYRRLLRELPSPTTPTTKQTILSQPSPIQRRIRNFFSSPEQNTPERLQEAEQFIQYAQAQRMYTTLIERYNPGMNMSAEEKIRLTARRVGMDLPVDLQPGQSGGKA